MRYLVNAGRLEADSWYRNAELEGSRFVGEGGHFIDTLGWWADSLPAEVYAVRGRGGRRPAGRPCGSTKASSGMIAYSTAGNSSLSEGDPGRLGRGTERAPRQLQASRGVGRAGTETRRREEPRTRASGTSWRTSSMPCRTGAADADLRSSRCSLRPARRSRSARVWRAAGRSGYDASGVSPGLVRAPAGQDVAGRGALACPRQGTADRVGAPPGRQAGAASPGRRR